MIEVETGETTNCPMVSTGLPVYNGEATIGGGSAILAQSFDDFEPIISGNGSIDRIEEICSGIPVSVRQLSERIADEYGRRDLLRFGARSEDLMPPPEWLV